MSTRARFVPTSALKSPAAASATGWLGPLKIGALGLGASALVLHLVFKPALPLPEADASAAPQKSAWVRWTEGAIAAVLPASTSPSPSSDSAAVTGEGISADRAPAADASAAAPGSDDPRAHWAKGDISQIQFEFIKDTGIQLQPLDEVLRASPDESNSMQTLLSALRSPSADAGIQQKAIDQLSQNAGTDLQSLRKLQTAAWTFTLSSAGGTLTGETLVAAVLKQGTPQARRVLYDEVERAYPNEIYEFRQRLLASGQSEESLGLVDSNGEDSASPLRQAAPQDCTANPALLQTCDANWRGLTSWTNQILNAQQEAGRAAVRLFAEATPSEDQP